LPFGQVGENKLWQRLILANVNTAEAFQTCVAHYIFPFFFYTCLKQFNLLDNFPLKQVF